MPNQNKTHTLIYAGLWLMGGLLALGVLFIKPAGSAIAAPPRQIPIYTPTPGPDGKIIWIVKANDTLLSISLITGVSVEQLRALNNLTNDTIYEGQKLLLGLSGPALITPTAGPSPTPTPIVPTPTLRPGTGKLCLILFNDLNGDSIRQPETEASIPDGALSVNNRSGTVSKTEKTGASFDPVCFDKLPEGEYTLSAAVPLGYNSTTETTYVLTLKAGEETYVDFGAQANSATQAEASIPTPSNRSPLLGVVGGLFLLAGVVVALFAGRLLKGK